MQVGMSDRGNYDADDTDRLGGDKQME